MYVHGEFLIIMGGRDCCQWDLPLVRMHIGAWKKTEPFEIVFPRVVVMVPLIGFPSTGVAP